MFVIISRYLQEIGYTDTIIDVRSNRVRSLLGLNNNAESEENLNNSGGLSSVINGNESSNKRASENQGRRTPAKKSQPALLTESMILDTEAAVMANFEFLQQVGYLLTFCHTCTIADSAETLAQKTENSI